MERVIGHRMLGTQSGPATGRCRQAMSQAHQEESADIFPPMRVCYLPVVIYSSSAQQPASLTAVFLSGCA